jgi:beta-xylosidase
LETTRNHAVTNSAAKPVWDGYFADPFAWRVGDEYFAIGTGAAEACGHTQEGVFPLLRSKNFTDWQPAGMALERPNPTLGTHFWAPEVSFEGDTFYLYYSVGREDKNHQLRVATSASPLGPYRDTGITLLGSPGCPFAIDPHPFRDMDGRWYLFYARDYLDGARPGTALAVRALEGMTRLGETEYVVLRARSDWQRFQANRPMHGGIYDWHTLEGACVHEHEGKYYCLYSGGRWENDTYGVDYGVAPHVLGPYNDGGNEDGPRVLRTIRGELVGPGHNSIVTGPDNRDYIVYHAWDTRMTARRMYLEPLLWTADGPQCESNSCSRSHARH